MKLQACCADITSHIPSHAKSKNSSSVSSRSCSLISGIAETMKFLAALTKSLKLKSPKLRLTASIPLTRPFDTVPPFSSFDASLLSLAYDRVL